LEEGDNIILYKKFESIEAKIIALPSLRIGAINFLACA
jgi:hypothetical protein